MAHGQPDFGAYAAKKTVFGQADLGELAVRLGSIVSYDRRGDVVWLEDFQSGLINWTVGGISGYSVTISAAKALTGGISCNLKAPNQPTSNAYIYRHNPLPVYSRIGVEIAFLPDSDAQDMRLDTILYDGTLRYLAYVYLSIDAQEIIYYDENTNWAQLASGVNIRRDGKCWHHMKYVVDLDTKKYVRLLLDNVEYDMSALNLYNTSDTSAPMVKCQVTNAAATPGASVDIYVNHVILTQNEP